VSDSQAARLDSPLLASLRPRWPRLSAMPRRRRRPAPRTSSRSWPPTAVAPPAERCFVTVASRVELHASRYDRPP